MQLLKVMSSTALLLMASVAFAAVEQPVVAKINNRVIKLDEFNKRYDDAKRLPTPPPNRQIFLEDLIRYEVGIQEAEKRNLQRDPLVAERIRQQMYVGLIEKDLSDRVNAIPIPDSEMKDFYSSNPEIRSSHILIEIKPGATEAERAAAKKRAEEILGEVKASKRPFEELVNLYTDDLATKKAGGDIGFQSRITIVAPYYDALNRLKVGQTTGLIETKYGYHIAKLTGRHNWDECNSVCKNLVRNAVFEKKRALIFNEYFDKLKKKYNITSHLEVIK